MNHLQQAYMMAGGGKWIQSAIKRPGAFTKKAKAAGMGVQGFANKVAANPEDYSTRTRRQANLAKTLKSIRKGEDGMSTYDPELDRQMMEESRSEAPSASEIYAGLPQEMKAKTLYEAVSALGVKGDYATRKKLFNDYFGGNYSGTAAQNTELLKKINSGEINLTKLAQSSGITTSAPNFMATNRATNSTAPANSSATRSSAVQSSNWGYTPEQWDQTARTNMPSTYNPQRYAGRPTTSSAPQAPQASQAPQTSASRVQSTNWGYTPEQWDASVAANMAASRAAAARSSAAGKAVTNPSQLPWNSSRPSTQGSPYLNRQLPGSPMVNPFRQGMKKGGMLKKKK